jgi:hypothetical protein
MRLAYEHDRITLRLMRHNVRLAHHGGLSVWLEKKVRGKKFSGFFNACNGPVIPRVFKNKKKTENVRNLFFFRFSGCFQPFSARLLGCLKLSLTDET